MNDSRLTYPARSACPFEQGEVSLSTWHTSGTMHLAPCPMRAMHCYFGPAQLPLLAMTARPHSRAPPPRASFSSATDAKAQSHKANSRERV